MATLIVIGSVSSQLRRCRRIVVQRIGARNPLY